MPSPAHDAFVARLPPGGGTPETPLSPEDVAALRAAEAATPLVTPPGVDVVPVEAGGVPALWVASAGAARSRTILYLHGGGYIFLAVSRYVAVMAELSRIADARCLGIDYRRAPEHPFPAPVVDATRAYRRRRAGEHRGRRRFGRWRACPSYSARAARRRFAAPGGRSLRLALDGPESDRRFGGDRR
jgi:acetyl esterase/lipase